ncbi:Heat shock protein Hsp20 [Cupriavidus taiwanensis]|uniref:Heat shock protein Hsp20 n=1 Tax=Cupriavidus taiwanensis TaxID=164546 RepID=A0A976AU87_9BURK|nr:Hsp20/alpha crystallin family protein [Cupriavidus taiwanensis]SOZ50645.1 Heat shock protein Hsp20 [Cupriavidus taiwanensis]SOZ52092.1 Heat shock protein Hsp20 [Cupriavidus taiwanensis]SOZ54514.1 Heat shock protein Hsp20 [Cupriavidus taiwanensis]SPA00645.1 Heat shock protein Hsp20 [Cupriavidus taiwanensis]SPA04306.1 Heat shock protein Hsp20 [Cupriavidus taiwanensis]
MAEMNQVVAQPDNALAQRQDDKTTRTVTVLPPVDIVEDASGVTLWADLPGVPREKLDVSVHDGSLRIEAEAVVPMPSGLRVQHAEIRQPHFARAFTLSPDLDAAKIEANLQDGVLKLTIPRREEARPRRIAIDMA